MKMSKGIEVLADEAAKLVDELSELTTKVKEKQARLTAIKTKDLADLMDMEGIAIGSRIAMDNGKTIHVKEFFTCNIPTLPAIMKEKDPMKSVTLQERRVKAFSWLDEKGKGDIIKNTVTAIFNREEGEKAKSLLKLLAERGVACVHDENVHSSTLTATLKEAMGNGEQVPIETFKIYRGTVCDIK